MFDLYFACSAAAVVDFSMEKLFHALAKDDFKSELNVSYTSFGMPPPRSNPLPLSSIHI